MGKLNKKEIELLAEDFSNIFVNECRKENPSLEKMALLVKLGADIDARDDSQCPGIVYASDNGHFEVVSFLVEKGANVHATDGNGNNALNYSSFRRHVKITRLLRDNGARW